MKEKLVTVTIVLGGILALAIAKHYQADPDWLLTGAGALAFVASLLRSPVLPEKKVDS